MNITQCSQSKTALQTVTSEGPDITTFGFVTDTYIHTYIYRYIQGLPKRPILQASKLLNHNR